MGQFSKRLEGILETVRTWPQDRQEDAADTLLTMQAQGTAVYRLSDEERRDIDVSLRQAEGGEFSDDAEVAAVRKKHGV